MLPGVNPTIHQRIKVMNTKYKWILAIFLAIFVPSFAMALGLGFSHDLPTVADLGTCSMAAAPLIIFGSKKLTLTQAVAQRGLLIGERNSILDAPSETRGEGESAEAVLSEEQRTRITAIDSSLQDLDTRIEEARERIRLDQEQRELQQQARSSDVFYAPDPARRGPSQQEERDLGRFSLGRALCLASEGRRLDGI